MASSPRQRSVLLLVVALALVLLVGSAEACKKCYADCDKDEYHTCETNICSSFYNCGKCGHSCYPGQYCSGATAVTNRRTLTTAPNTTTTTTTTRSASTTRAPRSIMQALAATTCKAGPIGGRGGMVGVRVWKKRQHFQRTGGACQSVLVIDKLVFNCMLT